MSASFCEILNSPTNSLAKNSEITKNLVAVCINEAIAERAEDDDTDYVADEEMTVDKIALWKMCWAVKTVKQLNGATCFAITSHLEKRHLISVNVIESVIKEKFASYDSSWEFVACVFVLIDILVWKEWCLAREGEYEENYIAGVNSSIAYPIWQFLDETVNYWVFFNGGWVMFLNDSSLNTWFTFIDKCSDTLNELCDFIQTL